MAQDQDEQLEHAASLPPEELSDELANEIAQKWDPDRLLKLVARRAGKGEALDVTLRNRYEKRLGVDLSHVRVYSGELAQEVNKTYNADAVTIGNTGMILMAGSAEKSMATADGRALLAHELTHVAQAQRGVFRDARFGDDMPLATEEHEAEAEEVQAQELAAEQGGEGAQGGAGGGDGQEPGEPSQQDRLRELVLARVLDMFAENGRVMLMRGGPLPRRP
jgi:hypothetical protein